MSNILSLELQLEDFVIIQLHFASCPAAQQHVDFLSSVGKIRVADTKARENLLLVVLEPQLWVPENQEELVVGNDFAVGLQRLEDFAVRQWEEQSVLIRNHFGVKAALGPCCQRETVGEFDDDDYVVVVVDVFVEVGFVERIVSVEQPSARNVGLEALLEDGNEIVLIVVFSVKDVPNKIWAKINWWRTWSSLTIVCLLLLILLEIFHGFDFFLKSSNGFDLLLIFRLNFC